MEQHERRIGLDAVGQGPLSLVGQLGLRPWSEACLRLQGGVEGGARQYRRVVSGGSARETFQTDQVRRLVPVGALGVAVAAAVGNPSSAEDLILAAVVVGAFALWAYVPKVPLLALSLAVLVPVVVAQRSGQLEPLFFEACLLAFVVAALGAVARGGGRAGAGRRSLAGGGELDPGPVRDRCR